MNRIPKKWSTCQKCRGSGAKTYKPRKNRVLAYEKELEYFLRNNSVGSEPTRPQIHFDACSCCTGTGLEKSQDLPVVDDQNYPHIAIIGGGIGGVALAVACLHRGIPFDIYERDENFDSRSQGYGLTLQQASKAIRGLGIENLSEGIISNRHLMHTVDGGVVGEWGMRKWKPDDTRKDTKRTNIHISRQSLRHELIKQLDGSDRMHWGHQLVNLRDNKQGNTDLYFQVNGEEKKVQADLVVGADGIRSCVRDILIGEGISPLRYLGCIVILGICPLKNIANSRHDLLDGETVFQTANGHERIYMMPYSSDAVMWQLSFPMGEDEAKELSKKGPKALKQEAIRRCEWHDPIPDVLSNSEEVHISGYPVYDRDILNTEQLLTIGSVTLIGDAAHPMSPFKGQGANQALLDALHLTRLIAKNCRPGTHWRKDGIRKSVLNQFETEMIERTTPKVQDSARIVQILHSEDVLHKRDGPRGGIKE